LGGKKQQWEMGALVWTGTVLSHAVRSRLRGETPIERESRNGNRRWPPEVSMNRIRIGYPAGYLRYFWIRIGFGYLFLKKFGSGQDPDIC